MSSHVQLEPADASKASSQTGGSTRQTMTAKISRTHWGIADQGLSSLTNFLVAAAAAKLGSQVEFGAFSVALTVYILLLWVARSLIGEPYVVRLSASGEGDRRLAGIDAVAAGAGIGSLAGAAMLCIWLVSGAAWASLIAIMGIWMPALLVQDTYRYLFFSAGRPRAAAAIDAVWLAVSLVAFVLLGRRTTVFSLAAIFGAGSAVSAAAGAWLAHVRPGLRSPLKWLKRHGELGFGFLLELITVNGMPALTMLLVAAFGKVTTIGALRAAILLVSPVTVIVGGVFIVATPEAVRARLRSPGALKKFIILLAGASSLMVLAWSVLVALIPHRLGTLMLGSNWAPGRHLLVPVALQTVANTCILAGSVGLRVLEGVQRSLRLRAWAAPLFIAAGLAGNYIGGPMGAGVGLAVAAWASAGLTWVAVGRAFRSKQADRIQLDTPRPDPPGAKASPEGPG
jgi:O-antigen/teichoic acid export membrane protein